MTPENPDPSLTHTKVLHYHFDRTVLSRSDFLIPHFTSMQHCLFHLSSPFYLLGLQPSDNGLHLTHASSFNTFFFLTLFHWCSQWFRSTSWTTHMAGLTTCKMQGTLIVVSPFIIYNHEFVCQQPATFPLHRYFCKGLNMF